MKPILEVIGYKGWEIVVARNYGHTTINAYTTSIPVRQLCAKTVSAAKSLIDEPEGSPKVLADQFQLRWREEFEAAS